MQVSSLSCPTCGGAIDPNTSPSSPTIKCRFCSTTLQNPFYKEEQITPPALTVGQPYAKIRPTKNWWVTLFLALFLGLFGAHRFYTGHIWTGLFQLFTFGLGGLFTLYDIIMIVLGNFRDKHGQKLLGAPNKLVGFVVLGVFLSGCVGLYVIGENASKVDIPAEQGWITGIERCAGSSAYDEQVLDDISIWESWGDDQGSIIGTVKHNTLVTVLKGRHDASQDITYYEIETDSGLTGWVSEAFIQFQPLDKGTVPLADC